MLKQMEDEVVEEAQPLGREQYTEKSPSGNVLERIARKTAEVWKTVKSLKDVSLMGKILENSSSINPWILKQIFPTFGTVISVANNEHPDSWKNIPATITTAPANQASKEKTTDHNLLSLELLLSSQPPTHQSFNQDIQMPPAPHTSYSAHKLKHDTVKEAYSKDMEEAARNCLQSL